MKNNDEANNELAVAVIVAASDAVVDVDEKFYDKL